MTLPKMQSLWVGNRLSTLERLSISSFIAHGHPYDLYTYDPVEGVPDGVVLKDANKLVPRERIADFAHLANFSDLFRYTLLWNEGGYWTDTDAVCIKPFDFPDSYVFSSEARQRETGNPQVNSGTICVPPQDPIMAYALKKYEGKDTRRAGWVYFGPQLMAEIVKTFDLWKFVKSHKTFCPIPWWDTHLMTKTSFGFSEATYAIHLWGYMWSQHKLDRDVPYPPNCLYEQLKKRYL
jgi:Glycosyltransferase sugar-binding region containing DXD motif